MPLCINAKFKIRQNVPPFLPAILFNCDVRYSRIKFGRQLANRHITNLRYGLHKGLNRIVCIFCDIHINKRINCPCE